MNKLSSLDYYLYHAQRQMIKYYNRILLKPYDLSYQQYLVLMVLNESDGMPVLKLGERLAFQSGTITPIIKKMEIADLVSRSRSSEDERIVLVHLASKGKDLIEQINQIPEEMLVHSGITYADYKHLMYLTNKIANNIEE
ncbi:MarR family transcriptional regulator [Macrococcus brunensis]|uniref:HTH-type transcriptional regulator SarZ n=1 Tax=Macrococcus brunensis TaxID=198483 RepID=A0A4R6BGN6_9STAP|nr:MarR family transcriptional regulator [Macrococcus brunensis]TDL98988.1 MarR family transcriptional regulator [Macrococcus brunensis]ULG72481.1 MarR family transcriptional regulator [Macrococcus brunensis]ULG74735.1 MarR family transcriptional regulator [Macrococcus brunensis]